ncbi:6-phospho-3-hexuloisomerase [Lentilactobacillus fungorum]|uniref:6-phospho-3-hexuloisomerase n=1 Tax=Lentilactobacillus fungorum TaxID=2201250 RepID=A0ABQ3W0U3_9LACO|nr:6-phospho-3-hexuloisomerase [Lentilactobacillus fungorum]GHP14445.1 6-phospho-3-hexuloisomerase [Lentilactobacillus fungorum]
MAPLKQIIDELSQMSQQLTIDDQLINQLTIAHRIFVYGAGRSGLALKMFAMRLAQLGKPVVVVGQITAPPIQKDDLLLVASGSGKTAQTNAFVQTAAATGARTILLSTKSVSPIAEIADQTIPLGGKEKYATHSTSSQPLGAAFEQIVFLYLEAVVLRLISEWQISEHEMSARHANLE